jgi:hypothetical protein
MASILILVAYWSYSPTKMAASSQASTDFFPLKFRLILSNLTLVTGLCLGFFRFCIVRSKYVYMQCDKRILHPMSPAKCVQARVRNRVTLHIETFLI